MFIPLLINYVAIFLPGALLGLTVLMLLPKKEVGIRMFIYIMLFILIRDTMTPLRFWSFRDGFFWVRFAENPGLLIAIGLGSALTVFVINFFENDLSVLLVWNCNNIVRSVLAGLAGAFIIILPLIAVYSSVPMDNRGGACCSFYAFTYINLSTSG